MFTRFITRLCVFVSFLFVSVWINAADLQISNVQVITISGAIGPATSDYFQRAVKQAGAPEVDLIVLQMDTPGGLDKSMRTMIQAILGAPVPVVVYVFPQGARAASAGTYLLYASHVAAMAPATNLGAATPVQIGAPGLPGMDKPPQKDDPDEQQDTQPDTQPNDGKTSMERKIINDAVAYIRGLAEERGRNQEWAELAVRTAASLPANEALEKNVIDLVAVDFDDLFRQLEGRSVRLQNKDYTLVIGTIVLDYLEPDWRNQFLTVITDPNVAYILMLIGIYGLVLEFYNPGMGVAGVVGAICLFLALYAFQVLPVSYTGIALILLGIGLMVAEAFAPSFGILGIGGVVAFVFGSVVLMDTELPGYRIAMPLIAGLAALSVLILIVVARLILRSRQTKTVSGYDAMIGEQVSVLAFADGRGKVMLHGELWNARSEQPMKEGDEATITGIDGLELEVEVEDKLKE